jgi:hypothetical protein
MADMRELLPGLWHWEVFHEPIGTRVSSYYIGPAGIVIDPKLPKGGVEALPAGPQQVVLTSGHHYRDAQAFADEFDIPIRASTQAAERLAGQLAVRPFQDGDEVAPGVTAIHIGKLADDEGALHIAIGDGAIAFADALNQYGGVLGFFPDELLGAERLEVKKGLKQSFEGLLTRDFDHLLFAHGGPFIGGGKTALREFVKSPVGFPASGASV